MSDLLQSGHHPDADQLNAFIEHTLPEHERQQTLAHLAVCPDCRAIVALSLPPVEVAAPEPFRKSWFSGWNLAWPMVAALAGLVVFFVHIRNVAIERKSLDSSRQVAVAHPSPAPAQDSANPQASSPKPPLVVSDKKTPIARRNEAPAEDAIAKNEKPAIDAKSLSAKSPGEISIQNSRFAAPEEGAPALQGLQGQISPRDANASGMGIAGTKTSPVAVDHFAQPPTGSNAASTIASNRPDEAHSVSGLHPQAPSPQAAPSPSAPAPPASASAPAKVAGAVTTAQTFEVAAAPAAERLTSNAEVAHSSIDNAISRHPLFSKLPLVSMVSSDHRIVAIDSDHALFVSDDDGRTWNVIPAVWRGRAVTVSLAPVKAAMHAHGLTSAATNSPAVSSQSSQKSAGSAALTGTVTDPSGAVIPDASVVLGNATMPNLRTVKTDRMGHYLIDDLVPGSYRVEVDALGFNKQELEVTLMAAQQNLANFTLSVGSATQTVAVEAAAEPDSALSVAKKKDSQRLFTSKPEAVFEITTDTGDHWTSTDGHTWKHQ